MRIDHIIKAISNEYEDIYLHSENLPEPYCEDIENVKAIVLGCDPSNVEGKKFSKVFGLDSYTAYFKDIDKNLKMIGLSKSNLYIDNLCKNYFKEETSYNKFWVEVADKYWIPYLKDELDNLFPATVPVLATAAILLKALCYKGYYKDSNNELYYRECLYVPPDQNKLERKIIPLFRHYKYSLDKWVDYANSIKQILWR